MTATVETVAEQLDLGSIMPAEKVVSAVTRSVTLTETDSGKARFSSQNMNHCYVSDVNSINFLFAKTQHRLQFIHCQSQHP